jgi:hypothetical protein
MEEVCIVVDNDDKPLRPESKKICACRACECVRTCSIQCAASPGHLNTHIDSGLLHRAFSVFLFDSQGRLLLQQRADEKVGRIPVHQDIASILTLCNYPDHIPRVLHQHLLQPPTLHQQ